MWLPIQITIQEKSVIMIKKSVFVFTQARPTHVWLFRSWNNNDNSDTNENDNDNDVIDNTRTMRLKKSCGDHKWLCFHLSGCWAKFAWTWQEKSWIQLGRTIIFICFCKQICLTVLCILNQFAWFTWSLWKSSILVSVIFIVSNIALLQRKEDLQIQPNLV